MSFTLVNSATASGGPSSATIAVTLTGTNINIGDLVVVGAGNFNAQDITQVSDGTNNLTALTLDSSNACRSKVFYTLASGVSGLPTYTATFAAATTGREIQVYVFTPSGTASFDQGLDTASANSTAPASGNITTTGTDELVFGYSMTLNAITFSAQTINGTGATGNVGASQANLWYLAQASTFTGQANCTISAGTFWTCHVESFKNTGGAAATTAFWHAPTRNGP